MKPPSKRTIVFVGLALVAALALSYVWKSGKAIRYSDSIGNTAPPQTAAPSVYPGRGTLDVPHTCTSRTLQQYRLENAPETDPPNGEFWGCWPGYEESARGPNGSTMCKNKYSGTTAPPQKFRKTGGKFYGCSFNSVNDVWACPSCEV